jgi:hypothetical protein
MIKYKYIMPGPVMWHFIYIAVPDADHKYKVIGPEMAQLIYEIASPDFAKKRSYDHQWKYQQQEGYKDQKSINSEEN